MWNFAAPIIGAGISGLFSRANAKDAQEAQAREAALQREAIADANRQNMAFAREQFDTSKAQYDRNLEVTRHYADTDRELQRFYAENGVAMRVRDARNAGVHPVYALGGNFASYSPTPVQVGATVSGNSQPNIQPEYGGAPTHFSDTMGQDIGRAIASTATAFEKDQAYDTAVKGLHLQKGALENELLASQIARLKGQIGPSLPGPSGRRKDVKVTLGGDYGIGPLQLKKDPNTSDMQDISDRVGEEGPGAWIAGAAILWRDLMHTYGSRSFTDTMRAIDNNVKVFGY